ncbi:hypothetical protein SDJN03_21899, partial [Cucurbita argyrosperma subsp. sororia]
MGQIFGEISNRISLARKKLIMIRKGNGTDVVISLLLLRRCSLQRTRHSGFRFGTTPFSAPISRLERLIVRNRSLKRNGKGR